MNQKKTGNRNEFPNGMSAAQMLGIDTSSSEVEAAARNLARVLMKSSPVAIATLIDQYSVDAHSSQDVRNGMALILQHKIEEATPDQLEKVIAEAKSEGVWHLVRPVVMKRNEKLAEHLSRFMNIEAVVDFLQGTATTEGKWLPGPLYDAAGIALVAIAEQATVTVLDRVMEVAREFRLNGMVAPVAAKRNRYLIGSLPETNEPFYRLHNDSGAKEIIEAGKPLQVLRRLEDGFHLVGA